MMAYSTVLGSPPPHSTSFEMSAVSSGPPQPPYVLPARSPGPSMPSSARAIRLDVLCSITAAIATMGISCSRAGITFSCTEMPKCAAPEATVWSTPPAPGSTISTLSPASSYQPFALAM